MADEPKDPSFEEMRAMLSGTEPAKPQPAADNALAAAKPAAEPAKPAAEEPKPATPEPKPEAKPAEGEKPKGEEHPASGTGDKETQEQEPKGEKDKKFEKKAAPDPETQKEINRAVWRKHQLEREAREKQAELDRINRELEEKKAQASGKPATGAQPEKPATGFTEAEPVEPQEDKFESYGDYLKAHQKFTDEHALWVVHKDRFEYEARQTAERQRTEAESQKRQAAESQQKAAEAWNKRVATTAEKSPDIAEAIDNVGPFLTQAGQADLIMQSDVGPEIVLYLHQHPDETMKLAQSGNPLVIARELGRIEARISQPASAAPAPQPKSEPLKPLPEPVAAVGGKSSPPAGIDLSDEKVSMEDWKAEAKRQIEAAQG